MNSEVVSKAELRVLFIILCSLSHGCHAAQADLAVIAENFSIRSGFFSPYDSDLTGLVGFANCDSSWRVFNVLLLSITQNNFSK